MGSNLVVKLMEKHEVIVADIKDSRQNFDHTFMKVDIAKKEQLNTLPSVDVVYNFASPASVMMFNDSNFVDLSNATFSSFIMMLNWSKARSVSKYIFPSSGTVYGSTSNTEMRELNPITIYGVLKLAHEKLSILYSNDFDISGLRIFMGYGPGEEVKRKIGSPVYLFLHDVMSGNIPEIWGDGTQSRDLIYISDIVEVLYNSMELKGINFFDVGTGTNTSFNRIIKTISDITGKGITPKYVPKPKSYVDHTSAKTDLMLKLLKREPTPPESGIKTFYQYLSNK